MSADASSMARKQPKAPNALLWIGGVAAFVAVWFLVYQQLVPFSEWAVSLLPLDANSHAYEALKFFFYDTPKVLMLLTLVVFGMGKVRSFFSPEGTRVLLAGRREGIGNIAAATLGTACMIKGIERVTPMIQFDLRGVEVKLHGVRQDSPPKMVAIDYELIVDTDETDQRLDLLHMNVRKYGTISSTVAEATKLEGTIRRKA